MDLDQTQPSLLSRLRDTGNHTAWREFEGKYRDLIIRYCRRRGLQFADADDVMQMVMLNLSRALANFKYDPNRGRFRHYLYRAVRGAIFQNHARPKNRALQLETNVLEHVVADDDQSTDAEWEEEWTRRHYTVALNAVRTQVEPRSVEMFDRLVAGDSVEMVAAAFATTPDAVYKVKQRMRKRLETQIAAQIREEDGLDEG